MLIREHFPELTRWRLRIIVSDFSSAMLARCRSGLYSQIEVNRGLPVHYLVKYFTPDGSSWQIRDELRAMLEVRELNLVKPWPALPPCDLVLMRNVLIYFTPETCREILKGVGEVLRDDGVLLLGSSECVAPTDPSFETRTVGRTLVHHPRVARAA
jgi:chemotaxis protein methyltransferase CheR